MANPKLASACEALVTSGISLVHQSTPSPPLNRLPLPAHLDILHQLSAAQWRLWAHDGLLRAMSRFALEDVTAEDSAAIHHLVGRAAEWAHRGDLSYAEAKLRGDLRQLPHGRVARPRLVGLAVQVTADISALAQAAPKSGSIDEMELLIHAAWNVAACLATAFAHEATLIDVAYEAAGIADKAAPIHLVLSGATNALGYTHYDLIAARRVASDAVRLAARPA